MRTTAVVILALVAVFAGVSMLQPGPADLVVYCAHDSVYAAPFLRRFTERTGITVTVRYDTEATKSLGLTELIERERDHPRCDVFWNNEPLGTIRLAERGLLDPYRGEGERRIPPAFRDPEGRWVGFAARLRVWILHTGGASPVAATEAAVAAELARPSLAHMAMARPLYGTTRSHLTALWDQLGGAGCESWHRDLRRRGIQVVSGNSTVKNLVGKGQLALGLTDTDDYFLAVDAGLPVAMVPATLPDRSTICVPNTAAIVKGTGNLPAARRLVDYLASAEAELELAKSPSRQIPLGPLTPRQAGDLPADVHALLPLLERGYGYKDQAASSAACLAFLKREYVR